MNEKVQEAVEQLHKVLNEEMGSNVVGFKLFISGSECDFEVMTRSPAQLKSSGISMKDIRGNWIK